MHHSLRLVCCALVLSFVGLSPAAAQAPARPYGFCYGLAGNPRVNNFTRVFGPGEWERARGQFIQHLHQRYGGFTTPELRCEPHETQAAADSARARLMEEGRKYPHWPVVELDWKPSGPAPAPAPAANKPPAAAPAAAPPPVAARPAAVAPAKLAVAASKPGVYVICRSEWNTDLRRFYNPPVEGRGAGYAEWQASFGAYLVAKHAFKGGTNYGCGKYPTLEAAQKDYDAWVAAARASPSINGRPSPIIITDWKY